VELHPARAEDLRRAFPEAKVVCCAIEDFRWPGRPFRVVANPPFAHGSALVRRLLGSRCTRADLVLPVQVAQRFARHGSYRRLPASAFRPRARVNTAVLTIRRR
jgi:23S rRNA (adenine-N6)-dimethyltransferase